MVLCSYAMYFFPEIIPEVSRILKNDGVFIVITHATPHLHQFSDFVRAILVVFYDNPLPVASSIVVRDRQLLLVRRRFMPKAGEWCLPMGFAEAGESIEAAALRELKEVAGGGADQPHNAYLYPL